MADAEAQRRSDLRLVPLTVKRALHHVKKWHRHLPDLQGGLFAVGVADATGELVGVAVAGNPPRMWQGQHVVISRVATPGAFNACSMLYGALCRAAKALGYREAWTYTLPDEPGTSLHAAGFVAAGVTKDEEWDRLRRRRARSVVPGIKQRWVRILNGGEA